MRRESKSRRSDKPGSYDGDVAIELRPMQLRGSESPAHPGDPMSETIDIEINLLARAYDVDETDE